MLNNPFKFKKAEDSPGLLLWQTGQIWQRLIKQALELYDISHSQFVIMATLMWFELNHLETNQVTIINWTKLDKMTVSKSLKKLAALELIIRIEHDIDTRAKLVLLTKSGKILITKLIPIVEGIDHEFFAQISQEEQEIFKQLLKKMS